MGRVNSSQGVVINNLFLFSGAECGIGFVIRCQILKPYSNLFDAIILYENGKDLIECFVELHVYYLFLLIYKNSSYGGNRIWCR